MDDGSGRPSDGSPGDDGPATVRAELGQLRAAHATVAEENQRLRDEAALARDAGAAAVARCDTLASQVEAANASLRAAAARYRDLVLRSDPALPPDLVGGDDIDAVEASAAAAREIVGRVRAEVEAQAGRARVPAGAPTRGASDLSGLSPEQKIRVGLARRERG